VPNGLNAHRLILASASPRRSELLRSLDVEFDVLPSHTPELHDLRFTAAELCAINARRKAEEISAKHEDRVVLGADTLVTLRGALFGKPSDLTEASAMLSALSGQTHQVLTAVCLLWRAQHRLETFVDETSVTFRELTPEVIRLYLQAVPVLDKAGAYGIQERGDMLVERIEGSLTNVIGLPLEKLADALIRKVEEGDVARDKSAVHSNFPDPRT